MRILWHSAAPWEPTGYGNQTAIWTKELARRGHQVAISAYHGVQGMDVEWEGVPVYPAPLGGPPHILLRHHARDFKADLIVFFADLWTYPPEAFAGLPCPVAAWVPIDTDPLSLHDANVLLRGQVKPIAMSRAGQATLAKAKLDAPYVPHAIDTSVFKPMGGAERDLARRTLASVHGWPEDVFLVGINANNIDPYRKAFGEQFAAFARFHGKHPSARLMVHSFTRMRGSTDLELLAVTRGIRDLVVFPDQERMERGAYDTAHMVQFYNLLDVFSNATYGEGFGIPSIEAQACGTPVVLAENTSGPELAGPGWTCETQPWWNGAHASNWGVPLVKDLTRCYLASTRQGPFKRTAARQFAEQYSIENVAPMWDAALEAVTG